MKHLLFLFPLLATVALSAQLTVANGGQLTVKSSSVLTVIDSDVDVKAGGTITSQGIIYTNQMFTNEGTLITTVSGTTPGIDFGRVTADLEANVTGTFTATKTVGYNPEGAVSHVVVISGNVTDMFTTENLPGPAWALDYTPTAIDLVYDEALPVTWLTFTGEAAGKRVDLYWATAAEDNTDFFDVERQSADGNWPTIGRVAAAGNTRTVSNYTFPDDDPGPTNPIHYRLRQVDRDGNYTYSAIVAVLRPTTSTELLYPNPTPGNLTLQVAESGVPYQVLDASGREVFQGSTRGPSTRIELPRKLANGIYLLRIGENTHRFQLIR